MAIVVSRRQAGLTPARRTSRFAYDAYHQLAALMLRRARRPAPAR